MNLKELNKRLEWELNDLIQIGLDWSVEHDENEHVYFVDKAYEFAHFNEIIDFFMFMDTKDYNDYWREDFENLKTTTRILFGIYEYYIRSNKYQELGYNFFKHDDLVAIIGDWLAWQTNRYSE